MGEADGDILLDKIEKHVGHKFPSMFLDFNEYGPQGILMLEYLKGVTKIYGKYSQMTPLLERTIDAFDSAIMSTASIKGAMRNSFLIKKMVVYERGQFNQDKPKDGFSLFGNGNGNGQDKKENSIFKGMT